MIKTANAFFTKVLATIAVIMAVSLPVSTFVPTPVHADDDSSSSEASDDAGSSDAAFTGSCRRMLGFVSWDCNVAISDQDSLESSFGIIASNIAADVAVAAAYLVIGYVVYGGYLYMFSNGDPGKIAAGRKTLANAFIGLAIVMLTNVILTAIRVALTNGNGNFQNCVTDGDGCVTPEAMVSGFIGWVVSIAGIVSAVFLVYGAILYITSSGDPGKVKRAKDTIMYSLVGLAIVALATMITTFVSSKIREANPSAYIEEKIINIKEIS